MTVTYLSALQDYEDRYDKHTVEICRENEETTYRVFESCIEKALPDLAESPTKDGRDIIYEFVRIHNTMHYFATDWTAGEQWQKREETIGEWMARDQTKDDKLRYARLKEEPVYPKCGKTGRNEGESRKDLKTAVTTALADTNWRLTNAGIYYRLGYLSGELIAYEREEDLIVLVKKEGKVKAKTAKAGAGSGKNAYVIKGKYGEDIIL